MDSVHLHGEEHGWHSFYTMGNRTLKVTFALSRKITDDYIAMTRYPGCSIIVSEVYSRESRSRTQDDVAIRRFYESKSQFSFVGTIAIITNKYLAPPPSLTIAKQFPGSLLNFDQYCDEALRSGEAVAKRNIGTSI
jgi:hypothetical protein